MTHWALSRTTHDSRVSTFHSASSSATHPGSPSLSSQNCVSVSTFVIQIFLDVKGQFRREDVSGYLHHEHLRYTSRVPCSEKRRGLWEEPTADWVVTLQVHPVDPERSFGILDLLQ